MTATKRTDYQKQLDALLGELREQGGRPSLLLHACCGPCSSYVIEYLAPIFDITILYYNPNIYPAGEYRRRLDELKGFLPRFAPAVENGVKLVEAAYSPGDFFAATKALDEPELQTEPEKGERCRRCYLFRMRRAYEYAAARHFSFFTTTLSISPFKDARKINDIGRSLSQGGGCSFLPSDFKKRNGFLRSLRLSEEFGLYRQDYCGCLYSKKNTAHNHKEEGNGSTAGA